VKQIPIVPSALLAGFIPLLSSCDTNTPALPEAQTQTAETVPTPETALMAAADSPGQADIDQAVSEYQQGKIEVAIEGFQKAAKADPQSAEARDNLGRPIQPLQIQRSSRNTRPNTSTRRVDGAHSVDASAGGAPRLAQGVVSKTRLIFHS
jgi:hypothetical protein